MDTGMLEDRLLASGSGRQFRWGQSRPVKPVAPVQPIPATPAQPGRGPDGGGGFSTMPLGRAGSGVGARNDRTVR